MNFDFKKQDQGMEAVLEKKTITAKMSKFKIFPRNFNMNLSLTRIPSGVWSIVTLALGVLAMHYKVENAVWIFPIGCLLYYSSKQVVPFVVMLIALTGMYLGMPQLAFLLAFSVVTMIKWS